MRKQQYTTAELAKARELAEQGDMCMDEIAEQLESDFKHRFTARSLSRHGVKTPHYTGKGNKKEEQTTRAKQLVLNDKWCPFHAAKRYWITTRTLRRHGISGQSTRNTDSCPVCRS